MKGTVIGKYNELSSAAVQSERDGSYQHAEKLWLEAARTAEKHPALQRQQLEWASNRAQFCHQLQRRLRIMELDNLREAQLHGRCNDEKDFRSLR